MSNFQTKSISQTLKDLASSIDGLSDKEVVAREHTKQKEEKPKRRNFAFKIFDQFADLMIIVLLVASAISIAIGFVQGQVEEIVDGCIILAIVLMNAIFGAVQENKAEKSLEALSKLTASECLVLRNKTRVKIGCDQLVQGDIVLLESGSIVPADLRLIETVSLKINESSLTGESEEVEKDCNLLLSKNSAISQQKNMAFKGTIVCSGHGKGVVVALGKNTQLGKISKTIQETEKEVSPLQDNIKKIGKVLTYLILVIAVVTFVIEICITPSGILDAFLTAVALAVAAIPESLPAVITIIMSMGVARLAKKKAIVKHMPSVETLGSCSVICSDKTGTITENKMAVKALYDNKNLQQKHLNLSKTNPLLLCAGLCNNALKQDDQCIGNPTEIALLDFCKTQNFDSQEYSKDKEIPFSSERKLMSVLCLGYGQKIMFSKGAPDRLLTKCSYIFKDEKVVLLDENEKKHILSVIEKMGEKALRVIGFAYKKVEKDSDFCEENLIFAGLMGLIDPPRKETKQAISKCKKAGMRPVMITGDYAKTAFAIAKEIGLASSERQVLSGEELGALSDQELLDKIDQISVFARVSPSDKVRIVEAFKKKGKVVAMTGDGVNDAPSLKSANIGIGMGKSGTDVAKEVADIIISDDNFATIIVAVEEGRKIYQNIQKTIKFLFSANLAEMLSLFVVTLVCPQYVFLFPVQLLFTNLISDSLPAVALGVEEPEYDLMNVPPRSKKEGLFSGGNGVSIIALGLVQTALVVVSYFVGLAYSPEIATTMGFYTLNIIQMFYLASMRTKSLFIKSKPFKNKMFLLAVGFCFGLMGLFAFSPLQNILKLESLSLGQWGIIFALSFAMFVASEVYKIIENKIMKRRGR